jgi:O-antigen ligase
VFWAAWAVVVGLFGLGHGLAGAMPRLLLPEALLFALVILWLFMQVLPLGGPPILLQNGTAITPPTISLDPGSTLLGAMVLATYGVLFCLFVATAADPVRAQRILVVLFAVIVAFAIFGLVSLRFGDTLLGADKLHYRGYATATFVNRNSLATFLAAGAAIGAALIADHPKRRPLPLALFMVGTAIVLAALFATASRMGVVAASAGVCIALIAFGRLRLGLLAGATLVVAVLAFLYGGELIDRVVTGDAEGRLELYRQVWGAILSRPWLGYGGGSFAVAFPMFQHAPLDGGLVWDRAHSSYLTAWFELGLVFGSLPLVILALIFWRACCVLADPSRRLVAAAAIGVLTVFGVHALVDFSAEIEADAFLLLAAAALPLGREAADGR